MSINIKNGTPVHGPSLCDSCTRAHIARGYSVSEKVVICRGVEPAHRVKFAVRDCSDYVDRTRQTLWDMEQIAWVLSPRGPKRQAGFVSPGDARQDEDDVELILE